MEISFEKMSKWEKVRAKFLIKTAIDMGFNVDGDGYLVADKSPSEVYLYLEAYAFKLSMPCVDCDFNLRRANIFAILENGVDGKIGQISIKGKNLKDLENWAYKIKEKI